MNKDKTSAKAQTVDEINDEDFQGICEGLGEGITHLLESIEAHRYKYILIAVDTKLNIAGTFTSSMDQENMLKLLCDTAAAVQLELNDKGKIIKPN